MNSTTTKNVWQQTKRFKSVQIATLVAGPVSQKQMSIQLSELKFCCPIYTGPDSEKELVLGQVHVICCANRLHPCEPGSVANTWH